MIRVPRIFSRTTRQGKLIRKLSADVERFAGVPLDRREAELADIREQDARSLLADAKTGKLRDKW